MSSTMAGSEFEYAKTRWVSYESVTLATSPMRKSRGCALKSLVPVGVEALDPSSRPATVGTFWMSPRTSRLVSRLGA